MILDALNKAYSSAKVKGWNTIYIGVDIHDTIVKANYDTTSIPKVWLNGAKEALQFLSLRKDIKLILYTCSHNNEIAQYIKWFKDNSIVFIDANRNGEVPNTALGCYDNKPYFNLLFDDKAGFVESDWYIVSNFFKNFPEL